MKKFDLIIDALESYFDLTRTTTMDEIHKVIVVAHELKEFNRQLVAAAKELMEAPDVAEWDDAHSKLAKIIKENN